MGKSDYYAIGEYNTICDVCGFKYKSGQLRKRWDGFMVCKKDWEPRNAQDFVRGIKDTQNLPWTRPESVLSNPNMLINSDGLVANNYFSVAGRGNYFPSSAGTSEGQFLLIKGTASAYQQTGNAKFLTTLFLLLSDLVPTYFQNSSYLQTPFVPHWLYNSKAPFTSETVNYTNILTFTNGQCFIPATAPFYGTIVRQVFSARDLTTTLLWQNPYSTVLNGNQYSISSFAIGDTGTTVILSSPISADLYLTYSTVNGPAITVDQGFEAWPNWRALATNECNVAVDSILWAVDALDAAGKVMNPLYSSMSQAVVNSVLTVYTVDDGRAWLTTTYIDPMGVSGAFTYNQVSPAPMLTLDTLGNTVWTISTVTSSIYPSAVVQYGRGGLADAWQSSDTIQVILSSTKATAITLFLDNSTTVNSTSRYMYVATLPAGSTTLSIPRTSFLNNSGTGVSPLVGDPIVTCGLELDGVNLLAPITITISEFRPLPLTVMPYMPGTAPFTANFLGAPKQLITWRGPVYSGYQNPYLWTKIPNNSTYLTNQLSFLLAAQAAYTASTGLTGPFAPVYLLPRADSQSFGTPNTFGWNGPDPNTGWGGYQYRPLEGTCRYLYSVKSDATAISIVLPFLTYLDGAWTSSSKPIFTDFPQGVPPQANYDEPHFVGLVMRSALYANLSGLSPTITNSLIKKCLDTLSRLYVTTGDLAGTWYSGGGGWYGFWNGEILDSISLMLSLGTSALRTAGYTPATLISWLNGNADFLIWATGAPTDYPGTISNTGQLDTTFYLDSSNLG